MSKILVICTGGTLSMVPDECGALIPATPELFQTILYREVPELCAINMPAIETKIYSPLLDSSQMTILNWNQIATDIYDQYDNYDGFVVLHGTDTMAHTGSALSFMLNGLSKPVILTGAQKPLSVPHNDARNNITNAIRIAGNCPQLKEIAICFDGDLLRANRAVKTSTTAFKAFTSPNYPLLGQIDHRNHIHLNEQHLLQGALLNRKPELTLLNPCSPKIRFFRVEPNFDVDWLGQTLTGADVVILQTLGDGNMPINDHTIELLAKANADGVMIINRSQCGQSNTASGMYASGAALASCHIISAGAQTEESVRAKLLYLFNKGYSPEAIRALLVSDMVGEFALASNHHAEERHSPLFSHTPDRHRFFAKSFRLLKEAGETPNTNGSNALTSDTFAPSPLSSAVEGLHGSFTH
ncbi:MAG: asparaginase [Gammaproteobacteria bacterium]|nr:asparaginase [Gammaproteobacteria bacterium]